MAKNAIVGQSGGPTSVINASLAGVYESCKRRGAGKVYGMLHGVAGLLERRTCVLDDKLKTALDIELLKRTPSSYLGSCRYKLPDWHTAEGERVYIQLFEILKELDIGYFFTSAAMTRWTPSASWPTTAHTSAATSALWACPRPSTMT